MITLSDLDITLTTIPLGEDDIGPCFVVSSTSDLAMKNLFPLTLGGHTFINRDHLVSYISLWMEGDYEGARRLANVKKRPSGNFQPVNDLWADWAVSIAYMIAYESLDTILDKMTAIPLGRIVASGKDAIWESGQDKALATRANPIHSWGVDAWGKALTKLKKDIMDASQEVPSNNDDVLVSQFLSSLLSSTEKVSDKLRTIKVGGHSVWLNKDAIAEVLVAIRQLSRLNQLPKLVQWAREVGTSFVDAWQFINTLPTLDRIHKLQERSAAATEAFLQSITSVERCKVCGSQVVARSAQTRSADEMETTFIECYSDTCATYRENRLGEKEVIPYTYTYYPNHRERL